MNIVISASETRSRDPRIILQSIMHRWLPLSEALLRMVVRCVPNPIQAQRCRYSALLTRIDTHNAISHPFPLQQSSSSTDPHDILHCALAVENDIINCAVDAPAAVVVYISKMIPVRVGDLSPTDVSRMRQQVMGFGRVFSGVDERD